MVASTLSAGNVAVIGFNTAQSDGSGQPATTNAIQFVLLAPIGSGTQIFFTDRSWNGTAFAAASGGEGTFTYTAGADLPAGTVITITSAQLLAAGIDLEEAGEALYVFQGTNANTPTTFLTAVEFGDNGTFNGSLVNTGLVVGQTALAIDADSGAYHGPTTIQHNALANPGQSLLQAIMDANNWATDNRDTFNAKGQIPADVLLNAPDFQIWGATSGGSGDGVVGVSGDSTFSGGTIGFNQVRIYNSDGDESVTYQNLHFAPRDLVIDTVHGLYFMADSDLAGNNRILQGNLADLIGNPGGTPTLTVLYSDATSGTNSQLRNLVIDPDSQQVFFSHGSTTSIQRVNYNTAGQTPVTLVNLGAGNPNGNANNFVDDFAINFATGQIFISSHRVLAADGGDLVSRNYIYVASGLTPGSAGPLAYSVLPFSPDDDDSGILTIPGEGFPQELGSLEGIELSPDGNTLYFLTASILYDHDGDGDTTDEQVIPGGLFSYALTGNAAGAYTTIWQQTFGGAGPQGLLDELEIDFVTGHYYISDTTAGTAQAGDEGIWRGSLGGGSPTLFETIANANGGSIDGFEVYRAPTLTVTSSASTYTETAGAASGFNTEVAVISASTAADVDTTGLDDQLAGAVVRISSGFQSGATHQDRLQINGATSGTIAGSGIAFSYDSTTGIMTLTGPATFAEYQAALVLVRYAVSGDNPTNYGADPTRTIAFSVSDGLMVSDEQAATVNITAVNDNPVNTIAADSGAEDTSFAIDGISVFDVDANPATHDITVTLTVARGTLTVNTGVSGGLTAGDITGNGTASVTLVGTQNEINATLANATGLMFTVGANGNGTVNLQIVTSDGGNTGTGGTLSDTDNVTITVNAVNDAPTVSGDGTESAATVTEDSPSAVGATVASLFGGQFSDATDDQTAFPGGSSANTFAGVAVTVNGSSVGVGQWQYFNGVTWVDIGAASTASAQFINAATAIRFNPDANYNGPAPSLTVLLVDSSIGATADGADLNVTTSGGTTPYSSGTVVLSQADVVAVNDAPVATGSATLAAVNEDTAAPAGDTVTNLFSGNFSDAADDVGATTANGFAGVAIIGNAATTEGTWQYFDGVTWADLPAVSAGSAFLVEAADSLRFVPAANFSGAAPALTVRLVEDSAGAVTTGSTVDLSAGGSTGGATAYSAATVTLGTTITAVNDVPVVVSGDTPTYTEGQPAVAVSPNLTVSDLDDTNIESATVTITDFVAGDVLNFTNQNGISGSYLNGVLTLTGSATVAQYQAALRSITYEGAADANVGGTDLTRTVEFVVNDGSDPSVAATATVTIADSGGDAQDDAFTVTESGTITAGDLLADNGSGADTTVTSVIEVNGQAADIGNQITLPSGALLTVYADGTFDYDPNGMFDDLVDSAAGAGNSTDTDTFTYTVDGGDVATVTITIEGETDSGDVYQGTSGGDTIDGNGVGNTINGDDGNDTLNGNAGGDVVNGQAGDDTLNGGDQGDKLNGGDDNDILNGQEHNDILTGGAGLDDLVGGNGNDVLDGGTGADDMDGGAGNDIYFVDDAGDTLTDSAGIDTVKSTLTHTLGADFEHLTLLGSGDIDGTGNGSNNTLNGNDGFNQLDGLGGSDKLYGFGGKDNLDGGAGADVLDGGDANDLVFGGADNDIAIGGAGNDSVWGDDGNDQIEGGTGADKLFGGAGLDQLTGGDGNDHLYGGDDTDTLTGGLGVDYLDGGAGPDKMYGGAGNDIYIVTEYNDFISENLNEGYDVVRSTASTYILGDNLEGLELQAGAGDIFGTGNNQTNSLLGNEGVNILDGKGGVDTIRGNDGNDVIYGGTANDLLYGGSGWDVFAVRQESVGQPSLETDRIYDLDFAGGDRVDLSQIDANSSLMGNQAFVFVGSFSGAGGQALLQYDAVTGSTYLKLDVNGDKKADYMLRVNGDVSGTTGDVIAPGSFLDGTGGWIL